MDPQDDRTQQPTGQVGDTVSDQPTEDGVAVPIEPSETVNPPAVSEDQESSSPSVGESKPEESGVSAGRVGEEKVDAGSQES